MSVIILGSLNMDLVARTPHLPAPGETVTGSAFSTAPGGKGANQAVAAARLGASTRMIGRVGADAYGDALRESLRAAGVDTRLVQMDETTSTGVAIIAVDDAAENSIIVIPGANGQLDEADVTRLDAHFAGGEVLLLQLEVPLSVNLAAARVAQAHGGAVILDPAPALTLPGELYPLVDILTPNQLEAAHLTGIEINGRQDAVRAADALLVKGVRTAIIKLGAAGALYRGADGCGFVPAFEVEAVDTVAAGDAFNGGLAAALSAGHTLPEAVRQGCAVAALAVTRSGAQPSMPTASELRGFLKKARQNPPQF
jgi:ribokinase